MLLVVIIVKIRWGIIYSTVSQGVEIEKKFDSEILSIEWEQTETSNSYNIKEH